MPTKPIHHDEDNEWVGGQIRTFRKNAKMTQTDLAKGIGDPRYQKYISEYENGQDHMPVSVYFAIIEALQANPSEMLPPRLFEENLATMEKLRKLNQENQDTIKALVDTMLKAEGKG